MNRFFAILGIGLTLATSASVFVFVPKVFAQFEPPSGTVNQAAVTANAKNIKPGQGDQAAADKSATPPGLATPQPCSGAANYMTCLAGSVMTEIASLFAWLLGVAMIVLDASVYYTVVKMGSILGGANSISAIPVIWQIMRNFGNIALIFGFIAIGIETILGVNFYGGTKLLPALIIVAVLLNFSLFFASALVDVSNLFATQFYTQINNGAIPAPPNFDNLSMAVHEEGVSNKIMSQLGLTTLYGSAMDASAASAKTPSSLFTGSGALFVGFLGSFLFIIAAFVMFSLAFILIARFVVLILLLVVSPIGVASFAIPNLKSLGKQWSDKLLEQAITAPVLILLLYVALRFITDEHFLTSFIGSSNGSASAAQATASTMWTGIATGSNLTGFTSVFLSFLVAMGLLLAVIMVSKKMSAVGAGFATKMGGRLSGMTIAAAAVAGAPGYLGRNTVGRTSQRFGERWSRSKYARIPGLGSSVAGVLDKGAKASFDARPAKNPKFLSDARVELGSKQKGGFAADEKAAIEKHEKYAKTLKLTKPEEAQKKAETHGAAAEEIGRRPQEQYAAKISDKSIWPLGGWQKRNAKAAENILKEARKKKSEKDLEAIRKVIENAETPPAPEGTA